MKTSYFHLPRSVYLLSINQIIGMSAVTMVFLTAGLIGAEITPTPSLATLPATMLISGVAVATIPAVLLMKKIGRKKGFMLSAILSLLSLFLATYALTKNDFYLFCFAVFLLGTNGAFINQYRFAALEAVSKNAISTAVSFILFAGIVAGITGPEIVKHTQTLFSLPHYAGAFISYTVLFGISAITFAFYKDQPIHEEKNLGKERPFRQIARQPGYILAVLAAAIGYGIMICIMTATPLFLHKMSHFSLDDTAFILQSHLIAMYIPSLFTGTLITRFGAPKIISAGLTCFMVTVLLATSSTSMVAYWGALVLLGIGWNFLFISGTVLLPQTYTHSERFKAQGVNDFVVVLSQMTGSFMAGTLLFNSGWIKLNLYIIPIILFTWVMFIVGRKYITTKPALEKATSR